ncbi:hypothetical protein HNQ09_000280 [Deinococcus budaensis]|uniref:Uncharacterized protein n=1 Tax=Deinococcus budaensis TaxID=1665626 RepID=A0A7W8LNL6_9DEIO|nr:hypothetical protein [Deinococcus budaensis]MBB5232863.1 hypothetical protein [Deinococcus budaensis]
MAALLLHGGAWAGGAEGGDRVLATFADAPGCAPAVRIIRVGGRPDAQASARVQTLLRLDQQDRQGVIDWTVVTLRDQARREEVRAMLAQGRLTTAEDFYAAAFVFQHGNCVEHFRVANFLAAQAMKKGYPGAPWIYAASLDRLLMNQGKPQHFGTQYVGDAKGCNWKLYPVDPKTTDSERARYEVPTLAELQARADQLSPPSCP